jgi:NAD(P)-dependent dehydrogenase (short-subunit alcohol dehydrogenase family)
MTTTQLPGPAVVTGAAQGLGFEIARHLMAAGADVLVLDIDGDNVADAARRLSDEHPTYRAVPHRADVASERDLGDAFDAAVDAFGGTPRLLVNNALFNVLSPIVTLAADDWQRVFDVIARGTFLGTREFARRYLEGGLAGGAIVNISTLNYSVPTRGLAAYCSSKAALSMFTQVAALELAPLEVRVNAIAPGLIDTPLAARFLGEQREAAQAFLDRCPMGRIGQPEDMAKAVTFLASEQASWITGVTLNVDGGMHLLGVPDNWAVMREPLGLSEPTPADWLNA